MGSKIKTLREEAEKLGIDLDANETISDLEAKIRLHKSTFKVKKDEVVLPAPRRQPVKHILTRGLSGSCCCKVASRRVSS